MQQNQSLVKQTCKSPDQKGNNEEQSRRNTNKDNKKNSNSFVNHCDYYNTPHCIDKNWFFLRYVFELKIVLKNRLLVSHRSP